MRSWRRGARQLSEELARRAIEAVKAALPYVVAGPPLIHRGPAGELHVDVPLMYHGFALDRIHYDPVAKTPSPKGRPVHVYGVEVRREEVVEVMQRVVRELRVVEAAEFRDPEDAWVVPLAWRLYIVAHVKVGYEGSELVPDYGLTEEVRRYVA